MSSSLLRGHVSLFCWDCCSTKQGRILEELGLGKPIANVRAFAGRLDHFDVNRILSVVLCSKLVC